MKAQPIASLSVTKPDKIARAAEQASAVESFWERLGSIESVAFEAASSRETGWSGRGAGAVAVVRPAEDVVVFNETGTWATDVGRSLPFRNIFRWSRPAGGAAIRLEHLRYGLHRPVYLFDLGDAEDGLVSLAPHLCGRDTYSARIHFRPNGFAMTWRIRGPAKDERVMYRYG